MDQAIKFTLLALGAVILIALLKKSEPGFAFLVSAAAIVIMGYALIGTLKAIFDFSVQIEGMLEGTEGSVRILFRVLGITLVTKIGGQMCRDSGEGALAMKLETLGTALSLFSALPLLSGVLAIARSFIP